MSHGGHTITARSVRASRVATTRRHGLAVARRSSSAPATAPTSSGARRATLRPQPAHEPAPDDATARYASPRRALLPATAAAGEARRRDAPALRPRAHERERPVTRPCPRRAAVAPRAARPTSFSSTTRDGHGLDDELRAGSTGRSTPSARRPLPGAGDASPPAGTTSPMALHVSAYSLKALADVVVPLLAEGARSSGSTSTAAWPGPPTTGWAWPRRPSSRPPATSPATSGRRASGSTWWPAEPARRPWRPSRSPASPTSRTCGTSGPALGWDVASRPDRPSAAASSPLVPRDPPARSSTSTAASTPSGADRLPVRQPGTSGLATASLSRTVCRTQACDLVERSSSVAGADGARPARPRRRQPSAARPLGVGGRPGRGPSASSRSTMPSTLTATRAWNCTRPSVAVMHVALEELAHRLDQLGRVGMSCGARCTVTAAARSRSYSFSHTRRPMAASSTDRIAPRRVGDAWMMHMIPHLSVPSVSHQRSASRSTVPPPAAS